MSADQKRLALDESTGDIICRLPKNLLDNILERLPIRDMVRTSILSTKWRYLWTQRTRLEFDKQLFEAHFKNKQYPVYAFTTLIHKILLLSTAPILKFSLYMPNVVWDWNVHVDTWLLFLSRSGITELELNMNGSPYKLPSCVFLCPNLKVLKVTNCLFKLPDKGFEFAKLQTLQFTTMSFSPEMCRNFVLVLPVLASLSFLVCRMIENFKISAPKLNVFIAKQCYDGKMISLDKFPNLVTVVITYGNTTYEQGRDTSFNLNEFLKKLPYLRELDLNGAWLKLSTPTRLERRLPFKLHYLTILGLHGLKFDDLDQILCVLCLLKSSPCLRQLTISAFPSEGTALSSVSSHLEAPDCMDTMFNLQTVKIYSIKYSEPVMLLVKCILNRSPNLLSVDFEYIFDKFEEIKVANELLRLRRASSKAEVIYSCHELASTNWGTVL